MKKLIFLIMIAVTMAAQGSNPASSTRRVLYETDEATFFTDCSNMRNVKMMNQGRVASSQKAPTKDDITVPIKITLDQTFDNSMIAYAIPSHAEDTPLIYESFGNLTLPKGTYDILVWGHSQDGKETVFFVYEDLSIDEETVIQGSSEDLEISVNIIPRGSDGTLIQCNTEDKKGNVITGDQVTEILWKGHHLPGEVYGISGLYEANTIIRTNKIPDNFKFTRIDFYLWTGGRTGMILPIDFSMAEISPTLFNWQSTCVLFCETPLNIRKKNIFNYEENYQPDFMSLGTVWYDNRYYATFGAIHNNLHKLNYNNNLISVWQPENYASEYELQINPIGSLMAAVTTEPAIIGMPLKRGEDGLCQVGINPSKYIEYNCSNDGLQSSGNPRYSGAIQYEILGNCAPILTLIPWEAAFNITYTGRYGENMQIDVATYPERYVDWTEEQREALGLPVCDVAVDVNGKRICESIDNWKAVKMANGRFDAEISTDNILIDESIGGHSAAKIHYDSSVGNGTAPTLTYLQFRNNDEKVTDRLDSPSDGYLEFYALAPIEKKWEKDGWSGTYFDTGELESVKAEWSPMGKDSWTEIDLEEISELFYLPGFGYCFRGYLNGVDKESENKWYDLRVRIEDTYGAYQEQTISPAFRIESIGQNSIQSVSTASKAMTVYTIDGTTVMNNAAETDIKSLPSGLYLVRTGNNTRKIAIPR